MGLFAQILGTLAMLAGVVIGGLGFALTPGGAFITIPYGFGVFISGVVMVCLGLLVEHVHGMRKAQERTLELLKSKVRP